MDANPRSSRTRLLATDKLRVVSDATAQCHLEARERKCNTDKGKEEGGLLGSPNLHEILTGLGGMEADSRSSGTSLLATDKVLSDAPARSKARGEGNATLTRGRRKKAHSAHRNCRRSSRPLGTWRRTQSHQERAYSSPAGSCLMQLHILKRGEINANNNNSLWTGLKR